MLDNCDIGRAMMHVAVSQDGLAGTDMQRWWVAVLLAWQSAVGKATESAVDFACGDLEGELYTALQEAGFTETWADLQDGVREHSDRIADLLPAVRQEFGDNLESAGVALAAGCELRRAEVARQKAEAAGEWVWSAEHQLYYRLVGDDGNDCEWQDAASQNGAESPSREEILTTLQAELDRISAWRK